MSFGPLTDDDPMSRVKYIVALIEGGTVYTKSINEALDALQRSVQLQPTNTRAYYLMGILYDRKRLPEQAMAMYKKAREQQA